MENEFVYIVRTDYYNYRAIDRVFSNEDDANKYYKEQNKKFGVNNCWWVETHSLIK